jgi:molecular chaperone HtpG
MEKSLAVPTKKVNDHICDDVALVILSKLPLKSLFRFSCVDKSWSLLFENPYFMNLLRKNFLSKDHSYYEDTSLLLNHMDYKYKPVLYSLLGERFENKVKLNWPNPYDEQFDFIVHCSASVNGILCIQDVGRRGIRCIEELGRVVLWNPSTGEFKVTPTSPFAFESPYWDPYITIHGFGYDQVGDDYKVIRQVIFEPRTEEDCHPRTYEDRIKMWKDRHRRPLWEIYCLKSNSWRKLDIDMPSQYSGLGVQVYTDGVCHWQHKSKTRDNVCLVSFDLSNETFERTSIPSNMEVYVETSIPSNMDNKVSGITRPKKKKKVSGIIFRHLFVLNGSIAWVSNYANMTTFHISVLGEVGVKESWIKLFIVGPLPDVERPIGVGKKGDIFFMKKDKDLVLFNLSTRRIEDLGIKGERECRIIVYK